MHKTEGGGGGGSGGSSGGKGHSCCPTKEALARICEEAAASEVQRQMSLALNTSSAVKARGRSKIVKEKSKHLKKEVKAKRTNLSLESALVGLQNHHDMKMHLPHTVTVP
eukprot:CAMPEP_0170454164 /NCGR_PEP_ID=MMETSP0123-20130129/2512_1 /TAXON_ID=182087 /ORGANISM="Favella ehrenbergii, Strain Fehren 1" /LENGTH=109 /DNA_ID=CAMNT_0010716795 /DNA_START=71 /DNA_END=397 /DNA_ORIENTATION=+